MTTENGVEERVLDVAALAGRTLHSHEMDNLLRELGDVSAAVAPGEGTLIVDLSGVTYATPSGVVWLLCALRGLLRSCCRVRVIPPPAGGGGTRLHYWLQWMGFYELLDGDGIGCDRARPAAALPPARERALRSETLLVLTPLRSGADVAAAVALVSGQVGGLLKRHLDYGPGDVANVSVLLSEACHNVIDHAGPDARGLAAAQVVLRRNQEPFVMIAVADDGVGVRATLAGAHPEARRWTDEEAIRQALRRGVSGVPDADRGLGLSTIGEMLPRYRGTLHLRSGAARVRVKAGDIGHGDGNDGGGVETRAYPSAAALPGVMVCLTLRRARCS